MDKLTKHLLDLVTDPNADMEALIQGMDALSARIDAENRARRKQQALAQHCRVVNARGADLRKLANQNLARLKK